MEYSLWNLHGPTLWPASTNSVTRTLYTSVNGETVNEIQAPPQGGMVGDTQGEVQVETQADIAAEIQGRIQGDIQDTVHSEVIHQTDLPPEIHHDIHNDINADIQTEIHEGISSDMQVCRGQPEFIAMKPATDVNEQMEVLMNHGTLGLDHNLVSAESDSIVLKVNSQSLPKRIKVQRPRRSASGRQLHEPGDLDTADSILPPVDNLWNNGIVGANVNVKTESLLPMTYADEPMFDAMIGRLPTKRLEPLSDESDEEEEEDNEDNEEEEEGEGEGEDEEEEEEDGDCGRNIKNSSSPSYKQNLLPRLSSPSTKIGFECGECGFTADTRPGLKRHITVVHPAPVSDSNLAHALMRKLSQCSGCPIPACRFRTGDRNELEAHVSRHVAEGYAPAPKKKSVPTNLQRVRYEREEYRCQMCSYSCTIEKAFYKHLKVHSMGGTPSVGAAPILNTTHKISCVICGKDRPTEADMNKHMRKHRDNRYFLCDICVFRTVQLKKLIQHRRMHTGEKPHLCPHCPYRSARRDNLRSHVRRVHKKDNLFCDTFSPRGMLLGSSVSSPTPSQD